MVTIVCILWEVMVGMAKNPSEVGLDLKNSRLGQLVFFLSSTLSSRLLLYISLVD